MLNSPVLDDGHDDGSGGGNHGAGHAGALLVGKRPGLGPEAEHADARGREVDCLDAKVAEAGPRVALVRGPDAHDVVRHLPEALGAREGGREGHVDVGVDVFVACGRDDDLPEAPRELREPREGGAAAAGAPRVVLDGRVHLDGVGHGHDGRGREASAVLVHELQAHDLCARGNTHHAIRVVHDRPNNP